jgi:TolA-binding protein
MHMPSIVRATVGLVALFAFAVAGCSSQQAQPLTNMVDAATGEPNQKTLNQENQLIDSQQRQIEQHQKEIQTLQAEQKETSLH